MLDKNKISLLLSVVAFFTIIHIAIMFGLKEGSRVEYLKGIGHFFNSNSPELEEKGFKYKKFYVLNIC